MTKTAIVTGASGGIGKAIALQLAENGFQIVVHYSGNANLADEVVQTIQQQGGKAFAVRADVSDEQAVKALFAETVAKFGQIDVVVHSAGMMELAPISTMPVEQFDKIINVNLRGTFLMLQQAAQQVAIGGRIITLSTNVITKNFPTYGAYIASKAGTEGLVKVLANELRGKNITVNAIAPGPTATKLFFEGKSEELIDRLAKLSPMERLGEPEDIANAVTFLASEQGAWVNGQVIQVNGGA